MAKIIIGDEVIENNNGEIVVNQFDGELVVSSRQIAENFGKQHKNVVQAIENIKAENSAVTKMFIESSYKAGTGKNYKEYLLTRDGFSLLVMGFNGSEALDWKLRYIEAFNKMEATLKEQKQLTPMQMLELQFEVLKDHDKKLIEVDKKVTNLENTMTIDYGQQEVIQRIAKERLVDVLGGKDTPAYKELSKKVFSNLWKRYKQVFHVASYKDTAKKDYEAAIDYIKKWEPNKELGYMIIRANNQIQFNN